MVLPILVLELSEPNPAYEPIPHKRKAVPPPTSKRDKLIRQWRQILGSRASMTNSGRYRTRASCDWTYEAMAGGESSALLHDSEHLTRLLLRRAWANVPRRQQRLLRLAVRCFDPNKPAIKVAATQVNHLLAEGRSIRHVMFGHGGHLLRFKIGAVQKNGSSPVGIPALSGASPCIR